MTFSTLSILYITFLSSSDNESIYYFNYYYTFGRSFLDYYAIYLFYLKNGSNTGGIFLSQIFDQQKLGLPVTKTAVSSGTTFLKSSDYLDVNKFFLTVNYSSLSGNYKNAYILLDEILASDNYVKSIGIIVKD